MHISKFCLGKNHGLINVNNICYANSCIQLLHHCPGYRGFLENLDCSHSSSSGQIGVCLICSLKYVHQQLESKDKHISVNPVIDSVNKQTNDQFVSGFCHDAVEFITTLLALLDKAYKKQKAVEAKPLHDIFLQYAMETLPLSKMFSMIRNIRDSCKECGHKRQEFETHMVTYINPTGQGKPTLQEILNLQNIRQSDDLQVCSKCKSLSRSSQTITNSSGKYFMLSLNRINQKGKKKLSTVQVNDFLQITWSNKQTFSYKLKACVLHIGSEKSGHNYALIEQEDNFLAYDDNSTPLLISKDEALSKMQSDGFLFCYELQSQQEETDSNEAIDIKTSEWNQMPAEEWQNIPLIAVKSIPFHAEGLSGYQTKGISLEILRRQDAWRWSQNHQSFTKLFPKQKTADGKNIVVRWLNDCYFASQFDCKAKRCIEYHHEYQIGRVYYINNHDCLKEDDLTIGMGSSSVPSSKKMPKYEDSVLQKAEQEVKLLQQKVRDFEKKERDLKGKKQPCTNCTQLQKKNMELNVLVQQSKEKVECLIEKLKESTAQAENYRLQLQQVNAECENLRKEKNMFQERTKIVESKIEKMQQEFSTLKGSLNKTQNSQNNPDDFSQDMFQDFSSWGSPSDRVEEEIEERDNGTDKTTPKKKSEEEHEIEEEQDEEVEQEQTSEGKSEAQETDEEEKGEDTSEEESNEGEEKRKEEGISESQETDEEEKVENTSEEESNEGEEKRTNTTDEEDSREKDRGKNPTEGDNEREDKEEESEDEEGKIQRAKDRVKKKGKGTGEDKAKSSSTEASIQSSDDSEIEKLNEQYRQVKKGGKVFYQYEYFEGSWISPDETQYPIDGDLAFKVRNTTDYEAYIKDGRRWGKWLGTTSSWKKQTCKRHCSSKVKTSYFNCQGHYECQNEECTYLKEWKRRNAMESRLCKKGEAKQTKYCLQCDHPMQLIPCQDESYRGTASIPPRRYLYVCEGCNHVIVFHAGKHSCRGLPAPSPIDEELAIDFFQKYSQANIEDFLRMLISTFRRDNPDITEEELTSKIAPFNSYSVLDNIKAKAAKQKHQGKKKPTVEEYINAYKNTTQDKYIINLTKSGNIVLCSEAKVKLAHAFCNQEGQWEGEVASIDGNFSIVQDHTLLGLSVFNPLLQEITFLILLVCKGYGENSTNVRELLQCLNNYVMDRFPGKHFNCPAFVVDMGDPLKRGIELYCALDLKNKGIPDLRADSFHVKQNCQRIAKCLGDPFGMPAYAMLNNIVEAGTSPRAEEVYKELIEYIETIKDEDKVGKRQIDKFLGCVKRMWRRRLITWQCYFYDQEDSSSIEAAWAGLKSSTQSKGGQKCNIISFLEIFNDKMIIEKSRMHALELELCSTLKHQSVSAAKRTERREEKRKDKGKKKGEELGAAAGGQEVGPLTANLQAAQTDFRPTGIETSNIRHQKQHARIGRTMPIPKDNSREKKMRIDWKNSFARQDPPFISNCVIEESTLNFVVLDLYGLMFFVSFHKNQPNSRMCSCPNGKNGNFCIHMAKVFDSLDINFIEDQICYQVSLTESEFQDLTIRSTRREEKFTFFDPEIPFYSIEVPTGTRRGAGRKCKTCGNKASGIRVRVQSKHFDTRKQLSKGTFKDDFAYFCFQMSCLLNQMNWRGKDRYYSIIPPFSVKILKIEDPNRFTITQEERQRWHTAGITFVSGTNFIFLGNVV